MHYGLCKNGELPMMAEVLKLLLVVLLLNYDFVRAHNEDLKIAKDGLSLLSEALLCSIYETHS